MKKRYVSVCVESPYKIKKILIITFLVWFYHSNATKKCEKKQVCVRDVFPKLECIEQKKKSNGNLKERHIFRNISYDILSYWLCD